MINILMIGGRRCGKTTVLASMCSSINQILEGASLRLEPSDEMTRSKLAAALSVIGKKMDEFKTPLTRVKMDDAPTAAETKYTFSLYGDGRKPIETLSICDFPGEWLVDPSKAKIIRNYISSCQVILIAIDTPYLFSNITDEGFGAYNNEYNKTKEITNFFQNSMSKDKTDLFRDRLILFVPLKCERYYHLTNIVKLNPNRRNYMNEISFAIQRSYRDLLNFFASTPELKSSCTVAITPILSAGGVDFVKFEKDPETGRLVSIYQEPEYLSPQESGYSPRFCEQPMAYTLLYVLQRNIRSQVNNKRNPLFDGIFGSKNSANQIALTVNTLSKRIKRSGDGYFILQDPTLSIR